MYNMQTAPVTKVLGDDVRFTRVQLASGYSDKIRTLWDYEVLSGAAAGQYSTQFATKAAAMAHVKKYIRLFRAEAAK